MNYKYVIIGINIVFASIVTIGVALYAGYEALLGVGFSFLILGLIISGMGLTFIEPLDRFYRDMARVYSLITSKVFEDTGLIYGSAVQTCRDAGLVVIAKGRAPCNRLTPGIGVVDGAPYIALPIDALLEEQGAEAGEPVEGGGPGLEAFLRDAVLRAYDIGRDLAVRESGGRLRVRIHDVRADAMRVLKLPLNPFKALLAALVSKHLGRDVVVESEEFLGDDYVLGLRVV